MKGTRQTRQEPRHTEVETIQAPMPSHTDVDGDSDKGKEEEAEKHTQEKASETQWVWHLDGCFGMKVKFNAPFPAWRELKPGKAINLPKQKKF